jgi:hypothetical protein
MLLTGGSGRLLMVGPANGVVVWRFFWIVTVSVTV